MLALPRAAYEAPPHFAAASPQVACVALRLARYCRCLPLLLEQRYGPGTRSRHHSGGLGDGQRAALGRQLEEPVAR